MNRALQVRRCFWSGILWGSLLFSGAGPKLLAQDRENIQQVVEQAILAPEKYTFQMLLKPGTDLSVQIKSLPAKGNNEADSLPSPLSADTLIERDIRQGIIRVVQNSGAAAGGESVRYFAGGWCAYDDPRRGVNIRRPNIEGLIFPMGAYHFPELLWAEPSTRQPDPMVKEGEPKIHLYQEADRFLEVDAASGLPRRFSDGTQEWTYSYRENASPLVVPEKLQAALRRVLPQ